MKQATAPLACLVLAAWMAVSTGCGRQSSDAVGRLPSKIGAGRAGAISIEAEASEPAIIAIDLHTSKRERVEAREKIQAGHYSGTIQIDPETGGSLELRAVSPTLGARLSWVLKFNDSLIVDQEGSLDHPLQPGESFFLNVEKDDFAHSEGGEEPSR